jgi:hypothetical protein
MEHCVHSLTSYSSLACSLKHIQYFVLTYIASLTSSLLYFTASSVSFYKLSTVNDDRPNHLQVTVLELSSLLLLVHVRHRFLI